MADLSFKGRPKPRQRLILESSTTWLASSRAISSQAFVQFREGIQKLHGDDCFVEFLQQLFPWVSITAGASSAACQIRSATDEISKFLHAAHDDDREGFVRLIRSTTERPRTSWSQLLHGQQTIRLCAKLSNFILDVFSFTRPNMTILQYACRRCRASTRVFRSMLGTCLPDVGRRHAGRNRHGFRLSTACRHHVGFCAGRKPRSSEVNCSDLFNIIFRRH